MSVLDPLFLVTILVCTIGDYSKAICTKYRVSFVRVLVCEKSRKQMRAFIFFLISLSTTLLLCCPFRCFLVSIRI